MIIEIPDPEIIMGAAAAFLAGLLTVYLLNKFKPQSRSQGNRSLTKHLEYYESQLIDMKIRLDALDVGVRSASHNGLHGEEEIVKREGVKEFEEGKSKVRASRMGFDDVVEHILGLITKKPMTSRDIQVTTRKTREHTSRMLKKLFEEGYVERNTESKPFTYSITDKGKTKLNAGKASRHGPEIGVFVD